MTLSNVTVNGISLGNVRLVHGSGGVTQFADANGNVQVNMLQQNGFPAGELQKVSVSDKGRVTGSYLERPYPRPRRDHAGQFHRRQLPQARRRRRLRRSPTSRARDLWRAGKIVGSSLEGSNTDIADEFTKLIVTQQAYSANTQVISTANQMVQDILNMLREVAVDLARQP